MHIASTQSDTQTDWSVEVYDADSDELIEQGTPSFGDTRYVTGLNASGKRAYAKVHADGYTMQTNTVFFP